MNGSGLLRRVLDAAPCESLDQYVAQGGGRGLDAARRLGPAAVIDEVSAAGLRGRGGAGFSTGTKWRTIADSRSATAPTSVVVNGAEGEPGTFKDRALLRCNPYKVVEGALIAAVAVEATDIIVCLKASFEREVAAVRRAMAELRAAKWAPEVKLRIVEGPSNYLFGEETALLEVIDGRQPFPRVDPPFRRGIDPGRRDVGHSASRVHLAGIGGTDAPPALVNNVETMANVVGILSNGADWYRAAGTEASPGTIVCTITGHTRRHAVGEVPMGTTIREAIELIGGGPRPGREILAVLSGVANPMLPASLLDTPLSFEGMAAVGTGLGAAGFIVFQDRTDLLAVAHGVARFLAVESCGQCEPCKRDGLAIAEHLATAVAGESTDRGLGDLYRRLDTVTRGARCALASQQERVIPSILTLFADVPELPPHQWTEETAALIVPLVDIVDGRAVLDTLQLSKQPDWTYADRDSGSWPAARLGNQPITLEVPSIRESLGPDSLSAVARAASRRPLPGLLDVHDELEALLVAITDAQPPSRPDLLDLLAARLRAHVDVTQRVLYPMVQRVAGVEGDDATWAAERAEREGLRLADLVARASNTAAPPDATMHQLATELHRHIEAEQRHVIPLLIEHLDADRLVELADALDEARLRTPPHTNTDQERSRPLGQPEQREAS